MNKITFILMLSAAIVFAENVAVFPPECVNVDRGYVGAFAMLLSQKYEGVSGLRVVSPLRSGKAIAADSNYAAAAAKLGVSEYIEIEAVGFSPDLDSLEHSQKTIVTVFRRDKTGNEIHKVATTLMNSDIEGQCENIAVALWKKTPLEQIQGTIVNKTMSSTNKSLKRKGIKIGGVYPYDWNSPALSPMVTVGFDMRLDEEKYFIEIGGGAKMPTSMGTSSQNATSTPTSQSYGGGYFDVGGDYYIISGNGNEGWYLGAGLNPGIYFTNLNSSNPGLSFALAPYIQTGVMFPTQGKTVFYVEIRVAQHVLPITTTTQLLDSVSGYTTNTQNLYPLEAGINFGICW